MGNNQYKFKIEKICLKNEIQLSPKKVNIFIGANNCGKTQLLKDILNYITRQINSCVMIERIETATPSSWEELSLKYGMKIFYVNGNEELRHISPTFNPNDTPNISTIQLASTMNDWLKTGQETEFWRHVGSGLVTFLNTDNRLKLIQSHQANDLRNYGARNVLEAVYLADTNTANCEISNKVRDKIKIIFGMDVYLDTSNPGILQYRVGENFESIPPKPQDAYNILSQYPVADNQGDGLRSALGIISAISAVKRPIILLDEPEAFLHPPQALQLGRYINDFIDDEKQIFVATHSADFLRGLFSTDTSKFYNTIEIVHLNRTGNNTRLNILDKEMLERIIKDPLLSSSRVLEGMFYKGIVATEGDADTVFYQRAFQRRYSSDEIHFVNAHNKQTLKKIAEPYKKLGIKIAMIADADIIREVKEFKSTLEVLASQDIVSDILKYRTTIFEYFKSESHCKRLEKLNNDIKNLIVSNEKNYAIDEETAKELLDNARKQLKKIRENADELSELKKKGSEAITKDEVKKTFDLLYEKCYRLGLFIVKVGELESWLVDYGVNRTSNKSNWIAEALGKLSKIDYDPNKKIWSFIEDLNRYFTSEVKP